MASLSYFEDWENDPANPFRSDPVRDDLAAHREAIAKIESGGNYSKIGPTHEKYGRALGKYQVMEANLPEWSQAAVGRVVTPQEFLKSPQIQDAIFNHVFGGYLKAEGPENAASRWFTGRPLAEGAGKVDSLGTSGQSYVNQYLRHLGQGGRPQATPKVDDAQDLLSSEMDEYARKYFPKAFEETPVPVAAPLPAFAATNRPLPQEPEAAAPSWGPVQNILNAATLGHGPELLVGPARLKQMWDAVAAGQKPTLAPRGQVESDLASQRDAWQQANPGMNIATEIAGQVLPIAFGVGAGNALIRAGARALGGVAPKAAPAMANFLMGTGGPAGGGVGGFALRRASDVASGAWQGAMANALTGHDLGEGAAFGAVTGGILGAPLRAITSPQRAQMLPEVAQAARNYGDKLPIGSLISGPTGKTVQALAGIGDREAVEQFNLRMLQHAGADQIAKAAGVRGLTAEVFKDTKKALSEGYNDLAARSSAWFGPDTQIALRDVLRDASHDLGKSRPEAVETLAKMVQRIVRSSRPDPAGGRWFHGNDFLSIVKPDGPLDAIYNADNRLTPYADRIKKALFEAYEKTSPEDFATLKDLDSKWSTLRNLKGMIPQAEHGLMSPPKVANKFKGNVGNVADDAKIGAYLPPVDPAGNVTKKAPGLLDKARAYLGHGPSLVGAAGIGALAGDHFPQLLSQVAAHPTEGAAAIGGLLAATAAKHAYGNYLQTPGYAARVIDNTLNPAATHWLVNPLTIVSPQWSKQ
jgi:hypothetical protein